MVAVSAPRVDDRRKDERFRSALLPPYLRRSPKVTEVLPILYLGGRSTGDFGPVLRLVLRLERGPLSVHHYAAHEAWQAEHLRCSRRDLACRD
jgi:hypothetical protein